MLVFPAPSGLLLLIVMLRLLVFELVVEELLDRRCPDAALEAAAFVAAAGASFEVDAAAMVKEGSCFEASVAEGCAVLILSLTRPS